MPRTPSVAKPRKPTAAPLPNLVVLEDLVTIFGVSERTPSVWRQRNLLPTPLRNLYADRMPVWLWEDIEAWAKETDRPIVQRPRSPHRGRLPHRPF